MRINPNKTRKAMPSVGLDLLNHVRDQFPDRCPSPSMTDREIWMAVGQQQVVKHLAFLNNLPDEGLNRLDA